jgi:hypothetical protein
MDEASTEARLRVALLGWRGMELRGVAGQCMAEQGMAWRAPRLGRAGLGLALPGKARQGMAYQGINDRMGQEMSTKAALKVNAIADKIIDEAVEQSPNGDVDRYSIADRFAQHLDDESKTRFLVLACRQYIDKRMRNRKRAIKPETAKLQLVPAVDGTGARWARPLSKMTVFELIAKAEQYDDLAKANQVVGDRYRELAEVCMARGVQCAEELPDCDEVMAQIFNPNGRDEDGAAV